LDETFPRHHSLWWFHFDREEHFLISTVIYFKFNACSRKK
jgi:hypothetical protein